jgi:hypothetical protein
MELIKCSRGKEGGDWALLSSKIIKRESRKWPVRFCLTKGKNKG